VTGSHLCRGVKSAEDVANALQSTGTRIHWVNAPTSSGAQGQRAQRGTTNATDHGGPPETARQNGDAADGKRGWGFAKALSGLGFGLLQGSAPGGALLGSPAPGEMEFEFGRSFGLGVTAVGQGIQGATMLAEGLTLGTAGPATGPGAPLALAGGGAMVAAGVAMGVQAAVNGTEAVRAFSNAMEMRGSGDGGGGDSPRNAHLAGQTHPKTGVPFDSNGYPDFKAAGVVKAEVKITPTGSRAGDFAAANGASGFKRTPEGYTWHHHQDGRTMQLVPRDIHAQTGHTGLTDPPIPKVMG